MNQIKTSASRPLVSVIIPCYNQGAFLSAAVDSVLSQTVDDWECIIVNDGSTDDTAILGTALASSDPRIHYMEETNAGPAIARNIALRAARGRYIHFLDADDFIGPSKFEEQMGLMQCCGELAFAHCDYDYADANGRPISNHPCLRRSHIDEADPLRDVAENWETDVSVPIHCFLFDARFFKDYDIFFDADLPNNEDWDCWMRMLALRPKVFYVDSKLAFYRVHGPSRTADQRKMLAGFLRAMEKQRATLHDDADMLGVLSKKAAAMKRAYRDYVPPRCYWLALRRAAKRVIFAIAGRVLGSIGCGHVS